IMNKLMVYLFPIGVVAGGPFFPLAILLYWLSNNLWTLGQQRLVYQRIDTEDAEKKDATIAQRQSLAPRPGQKPIRPKRDSAPTTGRPPGDGSAEPDAELPETEGSSGITSSNGARAAGSGSRDDRGATDGAANGQRPAHAEDSAPPGMIQQRPRPRKKPNRKRR
ncbi:MAG: membrane protein insertase YidC, partial [Pseudonocardiaceae bacterium]